MNRYLFLLLLVAGIVFRAILLVQVEIVNGGDVDVYLADEGIVGLMAMHILEGRELPVFFFGQHYLGALEAYLAALSFALFGPSLLSLRAVTFVVSLLLIFVVHRFARREYGETTARWAAVLVSTAPLYFLQWNLKARGGFVEHLVLVVVLMALFWRFFLHGERDRPTAVLLGLVCGIAFWVNQLVLAYLIVIGVLLLARSGDRRGWTLALIGFLLGSSLLIAHNVRYPLATFRTLARKSVVLNRVPIEQRDDSWLVRGVGKRIEALGQGADKLGIVFGVPPRAGVERLGLSERARAGGALTPVRKLLAVVPIAVFGAALLASFPRRRRWLASDPLLLLFFAVTVAVGYVSPRYMLPAYPLAAVMAAALASRLEGRARRAMLAGLAAVVAFNVLSWIDVEAGTGAGDRDRIARLVDTLEANELRHCYSAGPMYHAMFAAPERVIIAPLQKDRYPPYGEAVAAADRICYLVRDDQRDKRQHVAFLRLLERNGVNYRSVESGPYTILFDFEPRAPITAEAIAEVRRAEKARISLSDVIDALGGDDTDD